MASGISFDILDGGKAVKSFSNAVALRKWTESEINSWQWIRDSEIPDRKYFDNYLKHVQILKGHIQALERSPDNFQMRDNVKNALKSLNERILRKAFVLSTSALGKFIIGESEQNANLAAHVLRAATLDRNQSVANDAGFHLGLSIYAQFLQGTNKRGVSAIAATLKELVSEFTELVVETRKKSTQQLANLESQIKEREEKVQNSTSSLAQILRQHKNNCREEQKELRSELKSKTDSEISKIKDKLANLEDFYSSKLSLQGPVEYWRKKRFWHRVGTGLFALLFLTYSGGLAIGFAYFIASFRDGLIGFLRFWNEAELASLGAFALFVALTLVLARIFYRLFASQLHLWNDCSERVTMTQSYLALAEKGHAKTEFLEALLARLFAPASDGVVRDDLGSVSFFDGIVNRVSK